VQLDEWAVAVVAFLPHQVIGYTKPLWASLISVVALGARLTLPQVLALLLGMTALVLLIGQDLSVVGAAPVGRC
jgi:drug/metabolite transporter (DMT)-like permease